MNYRRDRFTKARKMGIALGQIAGGVINEGLGLLFGQTNNTMQQANQQVLTNQALQANEQLSQFNYGQQLNMWNATNYPAQVAQLQKAGLNPALLYAKGGMGGTTGSPTTGIGTGQAPGTPMPSPAMAINLASTAADVELKKAQAENIKAQTPQEAPLMQAQIDSITQGIQNQKATQLLTEFQTKAQEIQNNINTATQDDMIAQIRAAASLMEQNAQIATRNNYIDANTMDAKIKTAQGIMIQAFLQNENTRAQTKLTNEQIDQIKNQIQQNWDQLDIGWEHVQINQQNANTQEAQMKINKMVNNLSIGDQILKQGLMKLIPSISIGVGAGAYQQVK